MRRNLFHKSDLQNLYLYRVFYAFSIQPSRLGRPLGRVLADADQHDEDHTADGLQNGAGHADHQKAVVQNSDQDRAHHRRVSVGTAAAEAGHTAQDDGQHAVHVQAGAGVGSDGAVADDGHDGAKADADAGDHEGDEEIPCHGEAGQLGTAVVDAEVAQLAAEGSKMEQNGAECKEPRKRM